MPTKMQVIAVELISFGLIFLFIYTAANKLLDLQSFRLTLSRLPLIGANAMAVSIAIPFLEVVISLLMMNQITRLLSLYMFLGLMSIFTLYIALMALFAEKLPCGCGGAFNRMKWGDHALFNIAIICLAFTAVILQKQTSKSKENNQVKLT